MLDPLLSDLDVEKITLRAQSTLQKDRVKGTGIPFVKIGRLVRYRESDVRSYLASLPARRSTSEAGVACRSDEAIRAMGLTMPEIRHAPAAQPGPETLFAERPLPDTQGAARAGPDPPGSQTASAPAGGAQTIVTGESQRRFIESRPQADIKCKTKPRSGDDAEDSSLSPQKAPQKTGGAAESSSARGRKGNSANILREAE
jgi:hypothetical protein